MKRVAFAVPSGRPQITSAHNLSATSVRVSWRPPHPSTIHGENLGFRITYRRAFFSQLESSTTSTFFLLLQQNRCTTIYLGNSILDSPWDIWMIQLKMSSLTMPE